MKRLLSILLSICMISMLLPSMAFANTTDAQTTSIENETNNECTHQWNSPSFQWQPDYSCIATFKCKDCGEELSKDCSIEMAVITEADCNNEGECVYIATVVMGTDSYVDEKYVPIPITEHQYNGNKCISCGEKLLTKPVLKASTYSWSKIKLSWDTVLNANGYYIYRSTSKNGTYKKIKTVNNNNTYYIDTGRTTGKTYYYKIIAYKGSVKSDSSNKVSAASGLLVPKMNSSVTVSKNTIKVSWNKVTNAKGYIVYRKTSTGTWKKIATIKSGSTLSYKNSSVKAGKYQYAVKAYSKYNGKTIYSKLSTSINTRTLSTPKIDIVNSDIDFTNKIVWNTVSGATGYEIWHKKGSNGTWNKLATLGVTNSYVADSISHGYYYYYKVRAIYKNDTTVSKGLYSTDDSQIWYYTPDIETFMTDETDSNCGVVAIYITNNGIAPVRIYSKGAKLIDRDYSRFDRNMKLYDENINSRSYIDIPAGKSVIVGFVVDGKRTWYDEKSKLKFKIRYDGMYYWCYASSYYGFSHYEIN